MGRELEALLRLSSWCLLMVVWLFLAVPWVCLRFVVVVFPYHTHLISLAEINDKPSVWDELVQRENRVNIIKR